MVQKPHKREVLLIYTKVFHPTHRLDVNEYASYDISA